MGEIYPCTTTHHSYNDIQKNYIIYGAAYYSSKIVNDGNSSLIFSTQHSITCANWLEHKVTIPPESVHIP